MTRPQIERDHRVADWVERNRHWIEGLSIMALCLAAWVCAAGLSLVGSNNPAPNPPDLLGEE